MTAGHDGVAPVLGPVALRVADVGLALSFWEGTLGLAGVARPDGSIALAPAGDPGALLVLEATPGAPAPPSGASGLYHLALLLPDRAALGRAYLALERAGGGPFFVGSADHLVSEALYYQDPEGNGLELYADRPRSAWRYVGGELAMATDPLDLRALLAGSGHPDPAAPPLPTGTVLGHVHLRVGDLARTGAFYREHLGMEVTVSTYPGALFLSWGGYHHHLALNTWGARARTRPPAGARGLIGWEVAFPASGAERGGEGSRLLEDPDGVLVGVIQNPSSPNSG
jgi:catechol 2,3-dioxygenase